MKKLRNKKVDRYAYEAVWMSLGILIFAIFVNGFKNANTAQAFLDPRGSEPVYIVPTSIEDKIRSVFGKFGDQAVLVARCESSLNPKIHNRNSSAVGLFQIMSSVHGVREKWLENPDVNIQIAHDLFIKQGWTPWLASNNCHHLL